MNSLTTLKVFIFLYRCKKESSGNWTLFLIERYWQLDAKIETTSTLYTVGVGWLPSQVF
jgi:hypothetical protein